MMQEEYNNMMQNRGGSDYNVPTAFAYDPTDNLVKWQLDLNDLLERAEHILREDEVSVDAEGNVTYKPNKKQAERIFNDYGIQEIMRILSMYINRNTILSDYSDDEVNDKVFDFGKEVNDLIFMKYEHFFNYKDFNYYLSELGLSSDDLTEEDMNEIDKFVREELCKKIKLYPMIVRQIIDIVHSTYKRALYGGERDSLRTARQIQQTEQISPPHINIQTGEPRRERGILNPLRFFSGKYK